MRHFEHGELAFYCLGELVAAKGPLTVPQLMHKASLQSRRVQFYALLDSYTKQGIVRRVRMLVKPLQRYEGHYPNERFMLHYEITDEGKRWYQSLVALREASGAKRGPRSRRLL